MKDGDTITNEAGGKHAYTLARFDLVPPVALRLLAQCIGWGSRKYGEDNWTLIPLRENVAHAMNHLNEWQRGDRTEQHLVHAMARISFAIWQAVNQGKLADTYSHPEGDNASP